MNKVLSIKEAIKISEQLRKQNKSVVVAGGFFDILHLGHIKFLEKSKKCGDYLFVLLEEESKKIPVNSQRNRAKVLSGIQSVDYIVMLKNMTNNTLYDKLMIEMQPSIFATTYGDPYIEHKIRQAKLTNAKVAYVIKRIRDYSTTKYIKLINTN